MGICNKKFGNLNMLNYSKTFKESICLYSFIPHYLLNGYAFAPLHLFFLITYRCNLHCEMCQWLQGEESNWLEGNQDRKELTLIEIDAIVKQVSRQALISFSGGEPFIRKDMLDILQQVSRRNKCHVITNGTLLSEQDCQVLVNLGPKNLLGKGLILIGISLQAPDEKLNDKITGISGSFKMTLKTIKEVVQLKKSSKKRFPLVSMKIVICQDNVDRLVEYLELAENLNVDICNFMLQHNIIANLNRSTQGKDRICYMSPPSIDFMDTHILKEQLKIILNKKNKSVQIRFSPDIPLPEIINHYLNKINLKYYNCFSPWITLYIHPYGNLSLCFYCDYGNARLHRVRTIWNSNPFISFRRKLKKARIFSGCIGCCQLVFNGRGLKTELIN